MARRRTRGIGRRGVTPAAASPPLSTPAASTLQHSLIIFATALVARLVHVGQIRNAPFFDVLMGDGRAYDEWAQRIAGGAWLGEDVFYQAPLYPYVLGVLYSFLGRDLLLVRLAQAALGSLACVLVGRAATRLFSAKAGLAAGLMLALYPPAIFFDGLIQKTTLDVFLMSAMLLLLSQRVSSSECLPSRPRLRSCLPWLLLGLVMGALALTRENALALALVIAAWLLVGPVDVRDADDPRPSAAPQSRDDDRRVRLQTRHAARAFGRVPAVSAFALGLATMLVPVAARNAIVGDGFYLTTAQFGPNFFIGNNPRSDGTYMSLRPGRGAPEYERTDATELAEHALGRELSPAQVSGYWRSRAFDFIASQPSEWLRLLGRKWLLFWNADEMLDTESQETHAEWSIPLRAGSWIGHFGVLVPLSLLGVIVTWNERRRLMLFYAVGLTYAISVVLFYVFARYRFPIVPLLVLFAGAALAHAPSWLRRGSRPQRLGAAVALGAVAVVTNWPMLSAAMMKAVTENNLATALQERGELDAAIDHYRRAIALQPDYAPAYNNMGTAMRAQGRTGEAITAYQRALATMADYPDAHYNLANVLIDENRLEEAATHFRLALQSIPGAANAHNNLGLALAGQGKLDEAIEEFRLALVAEPDSVIALRNLGSTLATRGRIDEALTYLRRAVAVKRDDAAARYDLGSTLLEAGRYREAIEELQRAVDLAPANAPAHNNLGIALASSGRLDDAVTHFRAALRVDPTFADAARNLAQTQRR